MENFKPDENEMIKAIKRSGYLFESLISKYLNDYGFFVESNQVIVDPFTGKSREIDLVAETHNWNRFDDLGNLLLENKCGSKINFVFEIKNNTAPIVLLTQFQDSPNIDSWLGLKERLTFPEEMKEKYFYKYWDYLIDGNKGNIFTQYCSFQRKNKNSELMALHPDNIHIGLGKITQYSEESIESWGRESIDKKHGFFRDFLHLPVLLISDDLYELEYDDKGEIKLKSVLKSILVYNYHYKNEPNMAYVYVVTKKGLPKFIEEIQEIKIKVENDMIEFRNKVTNR